MSLRRAVETSELLRDKLARDNSAGSREKTAAADFAAFAAVKQAGAEELWQLGKRPLAWGLGLGLPALGVGHSLLHGVKQTSGDIMRDARNQALLTSMGVGGMQALGKLLAQQPPQAQSPDVMFPGGDAPAPGQEMPKLAALVMVDDLLEDAYEQLSGREKSAALAHLAAHRVHAMSVVRAILR